MGQIIAQKAIVVGSGIGGLSAACALAPFFESVLILERDALPNQAGNRPGTPQSPHLHILLGGGSAALEDLLPGFSRDLVQAGAVEMRAGLDLLTERPGFDPFPQRDLGWTVYSSSRALLEFVTRKHVQRFSNVEIRDHCRATAFDLDSKTGSVTGVQIVNESGAAETLKAALVIDASSRGLLTMQALAELAMPLPEESEVGVDMAYATTVFKIPQDAPKNWKGVLHASAAPLSSRAGLITPVEGGNWCVNLSGKHGEKPPADPEGFKAYAKTLRTQTIYEAIKNAEFVIPIRRFAMPSSMWRRFEKIQTFPDGLLVIGDAICRFNPAFGQGMSVAAQEAKTLKSVLESRKSSQEPLRGLAAVFFDAIQDFLSAPWSVAETDFSFPQTRGQRPPNFQQRMAYLGGLMKIAADDAEVHRLFVKVTHLMAKSTELQSQALASRVAAIS